jgi:hypothetical protein
MAANLYSNKLREMLDSPGSFQGTPGFQFARDQGLGAVSRQMSGQRGSGNALAALTKYGTGVAMQDYGNQVDRLGRLAGQEQQYELGQGQLSLGKDRLGLDRELGQGQLSLGQGRLGLDRDTMTAQTGLGRDRLGLDRELGFGAQSNQRRGQDLDFGATMYRSANDYDLGMYGRDNEAQRNWWDYNLGSQAQGTSRYNAETNRGEARSQDWARRQQWTQRDPWSY